MKKLCRRNDLKSMRRMEKLSLHSFTVAVKFSLGMESSSTLESSKLY